MLSSKAILERCPRKASGKKKNVKEGASRFWSSERRYTARSRERLNQEPGTGPDHQYLLLHQQDGRMRDVRERESESRCNKACKTHAGSMEPEWQVLEPKPGPQRGDRRRHSHTRHQAVSAGGARTPTPESVTADTAFR